MPLATTTISGAIIVGDTLSIDNDGILTTNDNTNYLDGYGFSLSGSTFSVNISDLSDNVLLLTGNQNISGVKTFVENIIADISGNATNVSGGLTSDSEVTDLSGITHMGSGKIISDAERTALNNISGIDLSANNYTMPLAENNVLGAIKVGSGLTITSGILHNTSEGSGSYIDGTGITLLGSTFSVNTNDLSNNIVSVSYTHLRAHET